MPTRRTAVWTALGALVPAAVALAVAAGDAGHGTRDADLAYASTHLRARAGAAARAARPYRDLGELLGSTRFARGDDIRPAADLVIAGTVLDAVPGRGFRPAGEAPTRSTATTDGEEVAFDDPGALWRIIHVTVAVDVVLSGVAAPGEEVRIGVSIDGAASVDAGRVIGGLRGLGRVVVFLRSGSPVLAYDGSLYADLEDGALITQVRPDGTLYLPFAEPDAAALAAATPTLAALRAQASRPPRTIVLERAGADWRRP